MIWYIFDTSFTWCGTIGDLNTMEINHSFNEVNTMTFSVAYSEELFDSLQLGRILYEQERSKSFLLHSVELSESEQSIVGFCYGLESLLEDRAVISPMTLSLAPSKIIEALVDKHFITTDASRKINDMFLIAKTDTAAALDATFYGDTIYKFISEISKSYAIGYKFNFFPSRTEYPKESGTFYDKKVVFETFKGVDRTVNQSVVAPVRWSNKWGDTRDELFTLSEKDHKNVVYTISGDEVSPITTISGSATGWDRKEMVDIQSNITAAMQDDTGRTLTTQEVTNLLKLQGGLALYNRRKTSDFTFTLNEGIAQVYGVDYEVGDIVSLVHEGYGITRNSRIQSVKETITNGVSIYEINFEE